MKRVVDITKAFHSADFLLSDLQALMAGSTNTEALALLAHISAVRDARALLEAMRHDAAALDLLLATRHYSAAPQAGGGAVSQVSRGG